VLKGKRLEIFQTHYITMNPPTTVEIKHNCIRLMRVDEHNSDVTKVTPRSDSIQNARVGGAPFAKSKM
jgi:hypothetical protein